MAKKNTDPNKKTRTKSQGQGEQFKEWRTVATATAANASELPPTAIQLTALEGVLGEVDAILAEQGVFRASKQVASRRLQVLVNQGAKLSTVLKVIAKQHYGHGNDKLVEFGIKRSGAVPSPRWCRLRCPSPAPPPPPCSTASSTFPRGVLQCTPPFLSRHIPFPDPRNAMKRTPGVTINPHQFFHREALGYFVTGPHFETKDTFCETVDTLFEAMDTSFETIGTSFEAMDASFEPLDTPFETMVTPFVTMDTPLGALDPLLSRCVCLMNRQACLMTHQACLISHNACLTSHQIRLMSHNVWLMNHQVRLMSRQAGLTNHHVCLVSRQVRLISRWRCPLSHQAVLPPAKPSALRAIRKKLFAFASRARA